MRFMLMSNHANAVAIGVEDRRTYVMETVEEAQDESYYRNLYGALDNGLPAHVFHHLNERDISGFNPGMRAPMTAAKQAMMNAVQGSVDTALLGVVEALPEGIDVMVHSQIKRLVEAVMDGDEDGKLDDSSKGALRAAIRDHAFQFQTKAANSKMKWQGKPQRVWILRNRHAWTEASNQAIYDALNAAEMHITHLEAEARREAWE